MVTEIALGQYCASMCKMPEGKYLLQKLRYADDMGGSLDSQNLGANAIFHKIRKDVMDACQVFVFRIKYFITCHDVDEELLREKAHLLFDPSGLEDRFLGIRWHLKHDVLRPVKYLGLSELMGKIIGELNKDNIGELPITRRMVSCILAQHYDVRGCI